MCELEFAMIIGINARLVEAALAHTGYLTLSALQNARLFGPQSIICKVLPAIRPMRVTLAIDVAEFTMLGDERPHRPHFRLG